MTTLRHPVTRATGWTVRDAGKVRPIVVTLSPDGIRLRQFGRRACYVLPYPAAYGQAVKLAVAEKRREKGKR